jgi:hypothetical protein
MGATQGSERHSAIVADRRNEAEAAARREFGGAVATDDRRASRPERLAVLH